MNPNLRQAILDEATKLVTRHQTYASHLAETNARIVRRGLNPPPKAIKLPGYWATDPGFDPYHVRARAGEIARSIAVALRRQTYKPRAAVSYAVSKSNGELRPICVFQVADNAVSRIVYKNLLAKNARQFSAYCYAYRDDLSGHDAVSHMAAEFRIHPRLFIAEFDFSKYFDRIEHAHLRRLLENRRFYVTRSERRIIEHFMTVATAPVASYPNGGVVRDRGIPQGTSISLFLANLAGFPLDRRLERIGVGFARYADDTVIWSTDYTRICNAVDALNEASAEMGVELNLSKSDGISILSEHDRVSEFRPKAAVEFVGYRVAQGSVGVRARTLTRAKERIAKIIYANLLEAPLAGVFAPARVAPPIDRDYVTMIFQLRRFLYGGLSEAKLARFLARAVPIAHYRGFMSFYPLVDDEAQLKELDGWLCHTVLTSLRKRAALLRSLGALQLPPPHGMPPASITGLQGHSSSGHKIDLTLPSFFRIARLFRKATRQFGPNAIAHPKSGQYYIV